MDRRPRQNRRRRQTRAPTVRFDPLAPETASCPLDRRFWPITSFRAAHQTRRVESEADIGIGGSQASRKAHGFTLGPISNRPTALKSSPPTISLFLLKGRSRRRGLQGRVVDTGNEAAHRDHSGNPAFRSPSINSFAFDCTPRTVREVIVKAGSSSSKRAAASRASASRPRWAKAEARQR